MPIAVENEDYLQERKKNKNYTLFSYVRIKLEPQ